MAHRVLRLAVRDDREEPSQHKLSQRGVRRERLVALPEARGRDGIAAKEQVPRPTHTSLQPRAQEAIRVVRLAKQHDDTAPCLQQRSVLCREAARVLREALRRADRQPRRDRRPSERVGTARAVRARRVHECDRRVVPQRLQHVDHRDRAERVGRDRPEEVRVRLSVAQRGARGGARDHRHARAPSNVRGRRRRTGAS
eukprot:3341232-Prymnesium_polylepis.1